MTNRKTVSGSRYIQAFYSEVVALHEERILLFVRPPFCAGFGEELTRILHFKIESRLVLLPTKCGTSDPDPNIFVKCSL
ncbi:hypothetical protein Pyn_10185 [Prunus yedoensis var. nudiflora]|uniref:Uncharacterized protein n=1 Tax=Prunus yedoensis var. nudiflora TaxID=2094558 RepID=A0A314YMV2_PRUYE|nr:hypothetical protein Pyn_10185 [Prunus yedoensis var. nudiflora]